MSQYTALPQTSTPKPNIDENDDLLQGLQNIPSNFNLALNGGRNRAYLSPDPKTADASLLDPEAFRRLSISTVSSMGESRGVSPFPRPESTQPKTWETQVWIFWQRNQGLFLVSFSQLFGALMNVTARLLELEGKGMHPFQILFARQGLTTIFCSAWMWYKSVPEFPLGAKGVRLLLVARSFSGFFGIYGMYYSLQYLPVADAVVLTFLAPSVASYACYLFFKESFTRSAQYASLISLIGVVLIARPTSFFSASHGSDGTSTTNPTNSTIPADIPTYSSFPIPTASQRMSAVGVAMIGVLGTAGAFTTIRWAGKRAHPLISVNYFSSFSTIISTLALTLAQPLHLSSTLHFALPANLRQWSLLFFLGICGFITQVLLTRGLAIGGRGGDTRAASMIYTNLLFALALDKIVFGQSPGWWSLGGSGLILGSAVFVAVQKGQTEREPGDEEGGVRRERGEGTAEEEMGMLSGRGIEDDVEDESGVEDEWGGVGLREFPPPRP